MAILLGGVLLAPGMGWAQESMDDVMGGFDEEETLDLEPTEAFEETWWDLSGSLDFTSSYNYEHDNPPAGMTDFRGWSKLRFQLALQLDLDLPHDWKARIAGKGSYDAIYSSRGNQHYTSQVKDLYEKEDELTEVWVQGALLENLDIKVGRSY